MTHTSPNVPSLGESVELMLPALSARLVPPSAHGDLLDLARRLPPIPRCGFEVRLGTSPEVDFQQGIRAQGDELQKLRDYLARSSIGGPAWRRIDRLLAEWDARGSSLRGVDELWLEFDRPPQSSLSVFVGFDREIPLGDRRRVAYDSLDLLVGRAGWEQWQAALDHCFEACRSDSVVSHVGLMLGRPAPFLRVNVKHLDPEQTNEYLHGIGWEGDRQEATKLVRRLRALTDRATLCLDVGETVGGRLGIECSLEAQPPGESRWVDLFEYLVERGWCLPGKRDAVLGWPGPTTPVDAAGEWPAHLVRAELRRPADHFTSLERRISHVKVTWEPGRDPTAKAYFGFEHKWLRPPLETDVRPPSAPRIRRAANGLDDAVHAATEFLLDSRSSAGWWRDFHGLVDATEDWAEAFGWSDEWVTAFAASALADVADHRALQAARAAWELLVERRLPVGGWGYNRLAPLDADSTAWGLRLAAAIGSAEASPARAAYRILEGYEQEDGGLTTYRPAECPRPRVPRLTPPNGSYEGWCRTSHPCVTAAAAAIRGGRQLGFLRRAQRADGSWPAYWWDDDEYATALAAEALAARGGAGDVERVDRAVAWALGQVSEDRAVRGSAFVTAWCVRLLHLRTADARARETFLGAVASLVDRQETDGGWPASARLLAPRPDVHDRLTSDAATARTLDDGRIFTTATALSALARARTSLR